MESNVNSKVRFVTVVAAVLFGLAAAYVCLRVCEWRRQQARFGQLMVELAAACDNYIAVVEAHPEVTRLAQQRDEHFANMYRIEQEYYAAKASGADVPALERQAASYAREMLQSRVVGDELKEAREGEVDEAQQEVYRAMTRIAEETPIFWATRMGEIQQSTNKVHIYKFDSVDGEVGSWFDVLAVANELLYERNPSEDEWEQALFEEHSIAARKVFDWKYEHPGYRSLVDWVCEKQVKGNE